MALTQIYPAACSIIVSLLDLHPQSPDCCDSESLEIFEAGTGHGALTLHLARAIHGANTTAPGIPSLEQKCSSEAAPFSKVTETSERQLQSPEMQVTEVPEASTHDTRPRASDTHALTVWKANRRAVIHSLDNRRPISKHAEDTIMNFRRGMYYPNVDFHVGSIEDYIAKRLEISNGQPVLDHAVLDLPEVDAYLRFVSPAMKEGGRLITFTPSISSLIDCMKVVKRENLPFWLESVTEVGAGLCEGGREWDIRMVRPRASQGVSSTAADGMDDQQMEDEQDSLVSSVEESLDSKDDRDLLNVEASSTEDNDKKLKFICRPKIGLRVTVGAFIGLWKRKTA